MKKHFWRQMNSPKPSRKAGKPISKMIRMELDPENLRPMFPQEMVDNTVTIIDELLAEIRAEERPDLQLEHGFISGALMALHAFKIAGESVLTEDQFVFVGGLILALDAIAERGDDEPSNPA